MDVLINSLPALLAVIVTFLLTQYSNFAKQRKIKKAMRLIFYCSIQSFIAFYSNNSNPALSWHNTFWDKHYIDIAKLFPNEFLLFYELIEKANAASVSTYPGTQPLKKEIIDKANFLLQSLK